MHLHINESVYIVYARTYECKCIYIMNAHTYEYKCIYNICTCIHMTSSEIMLWKRPLRNYVHIYAFVHM